MRGVDESLYREARLKPAQQEFAASEFHGLKPGVRGLHVEESKWHGQARHAGEDACGTFDMGKMPMPPQGIMKKLRDELLPPGTDFSYVGGPLQSATSVILVRAGRGVSLP